MVQGVSKISTLWNSGHLLVPKRSFIHFRQIQAHNSIKISAQRPLISIDRQLYRVSQKSPTLGNPGSWALRYHYQPYLKHKKSEDSITFDDGTGCLKNFHTLEPWTSDSACPQKIIHTFSPNIGTQFY